jgi:hypothetical protein
MGPCLQHSVEKINALPERLLMKNYYQLLGIPQEASEDEIKKHQQEYSARTNKYLPGGMHRDDLLSSEGFREISEGFSILLDRVKRKQYDEELARYTMHSAPRYSGGLHGGISSGSTGHAPAAKRYGLVCEPVELAEGRLLIDFRITGQLKMFFNVGKYIGLAAIIIGVLCLVIGIALGSAFSFSVPSHKKIVLLSALEIMLGSGLFAVCRWHEKWYNWRHNRGHLVQWDDKLVVVHPGGETEPVKELVRYRYFFRPVILVKVLTAAGKRVVFNFRPGSGNHLHVPHQELRDIAERSGARYAETFYWVLNEWL